MTNRYVLVGLTLATIDGHCLTKFLSTLKSFFTYIYDQETIYISFYHANLPDFIQNELDV